MPTQATVDSLVNSIACAEAHVRSEYVRDLAGTMATVGASPHYAVTAEPGVVGVISGREEVAAFYEAAHQVAIPQASRFLTQIAGDWYMFVENMPTRTWIADGSLRTVHTATLFITGEHGIIGEFVWERPPGGDTPTGPLPLGSLRSLTLHEALLAAICEGDDAALGGLLAPGCTWAERDYLSDAPGGAILQLQGSEASANYFARLRDRYRPVQVSVLNRQATGWYVFAEELWTVAGSNGDLRQLHKATIYGVDAAGSIQSAIGYGRDPEASSGDIGQSLGQAFWPASEPGPFGRTRTPSPM